MQAGCGFKTSAPVFAVPLPPVAGESPCRLGVTSSPPMDPGSDVVMTGGRRSGQWVTLSKALLLQLVERICQLSFQTDMTSSNVTSSSLRSNRKSTDELDIEPEAERKRRPSSADSTKERPESGVEIDDGCAVMEEMVVQPGQKSPRRDDSEPTNSGGNSTISDLSTLMPAGAPLTPPVSCSNAYHTSVAAKVCVDASSSIANDGVVEAEVTQCDRDATETVDVPAACSHCAEDQPNYRRIHPRHIHQGSGVCRRRILRARHRKKATSGGQVRWPAEKRRVDEEASSVGGRRRPRLRTDRRCRQTWMALSKDIVYGAVENELRQAEEGSPPSSPPRAPTPPTCKSAVIWNPATCLSPFEKRLSYSAVTAAPADLKSSPALCNFWYRDVTPCQTGNDVIARHFKSAASSSMLSDLLGFGSATPTILLPSEVVISRQRHWSYGGHETVSGPSDVIFTCGPDETVTRRADQADVHSASEYDRQDVDVTSALNYCVRPSTTTQPEVETVPAVSRIWRPAESGPTVSCPRRSSRPRWVAVNKGDVTSLVHDLVTSMIASDDAAGCASSVSVSASHTVASAPSLCPASTSATYQPAFHLSARCSVAASEPRKWKSDLLQRMRNEDTT